MDDGTEASGAVRSRSAAVVQCPMVVFAGVELDDGTAPCSTEIQRPE